MIYLNLLTLYRAVPHIVEEVLLKLPASNILNFYDSDAEIGDLMNSYISFWSRLIRQEFPNDPCILSEFDRKISMCRSDGVEG